MTCYGPTDEDLNEECQKELMEDEIIIYRVQRVTERRGCEISENPRLDEWWDKHKKDDREREIREIAAQKEYERAVELATTKTVYELTDDELDLLNKYSMLG